ncbi:cbb3-type cytochrome c oxidase subunit I [Candidatus Poriferisocius sp.]|uniref:cbb3-type cytochrome c oxidase subunit I n=1 Tax=Candidatus Poriferisocius sp. TaxID=3101276 RepID=UPI003B02A735
MTLTETRPETEAPETEAPETEAVAAGGDSGLLPQPPPAGWTPPTGLAGILSTGDHRVIGRLYVVFSLLLCGLALTLGILLGIEQADIDGGFGVFGDANELFQVFGLYRTTLILCGLVPLFLGLATVIVPRQLGASSVAFPRAAAAAFWTWLVGAVTHIVATFAYGGLGSLGAGAARVQSVELTVLSLGVIGIGLLAGAGVVFTTVVTQRPAGMDLLQVPAFSWSMLVATGVWLFSLPVLLANLVISWVDMRGTGAEGFGTGDAPFQQVAWAFDAPQVYAWTIPALGIVAEVFTAAHRSRPRMFEPMAVIVGVFGFLSFGAWAQSFFDSPDPRATDAHVVTDEVLFTAFGLGIALVVLAYGGWLAYNAVASGQRPRISPQFALVTSAVVLLTAAVVAGVLRVAEPALGVLREADGDIWRGFFDAMDDLGGSSLVTGMMNFAVLAGLLAAVGGLYHWGPRMLDRPLNAPLGFLSVVPLAGGAILVGLTDVLSGFFDQPAEPYGVGNPPYGPRSFDRIDALGFVEFLNVIGLIGYIAVLGGLVLVVLNLVRSLAGPEVGVAADRGVEV